MATISDVARVAGVSVSTVSYTINGSRPISEATRLRVFAAMDALSYQPHAMARGLASKRSRILGLHFPMEDRGLGFTELEFVVGAADTAFAGGYHLILSPLMSEQPRELLQLTQQGLVDGVILMEVLQDDPRVEALRALRFPFAMIGRCADNRGIDYVDTDFESTMSDAVCYLAALGHTSLAYITQSHQTFDSGYGPVVRTCATFTQALLQHDIAGAIYFCGASAADGNAILRTIFEEQPAVTALLAMNDRALVGIVQGLDDLGYSLPADISLVTLVSSMRIGELFRPPVTTFAVPSSEMARLGVELLIDRLENPAHPIRQLLIPCTMVDQGSAAAPAHMHVVRV